MTVVLIYLNGQVRCSCPRNWVKAPLNPADINVPNDPDYDVAVFVHCTKTIFEDFKRPLEKLNIVALKPQFIEIQLPSPQ
jgi:hypothetical protein